MVEPQKTLHESNFYKVCELEKQLSNDELRLGYVVEAQSRLEKRLEEMEEKLVPKETIFAVLQETRLHYPTAITLLGGYFELPSSVKHFERDLERAVSSIVEDAMDDEPVTCEETATLEDVATLLHKREISRVPVVRDGRLVGIVARGDILQAIVSGDPEA